MASPSIDPIATANAVIDASRDLASSPDDAAKWTDVELNARLVADKLRTKGPADYHTRVGATELPKAMASLLDLASSGKDQTPRSPEAAAAAFELLRVGANLCMDHDENRQLLLNAGVPQRLVALLRAYSRRHPYNDDQANASVSISDLKLIRTSVGLLLNASFYEPVRNALMEERAPTAVLAVAFTLYKPLAWVQALAAANTPEQIQTVDEQWKLRSGIANWATRFISEFTENDTKQAFDIDCLPYIIGSVRVFTPPYPAPSPATFDTLSGRQTFIETDVDVLDQCSSLLEALSLDVEIVLTEIGKSVSAEPERAYLRHLVAFVEDGNYPPFWAPETSAKQFEKTYDLCKAAVVKTIVAVAGGDSNLDVLWQETVDATEPNGWFVSTMLRWIQQHVENKDSWTRDDLTICATLSLGNLARRESICDSLAQPPISIAAKLLPLLAPKTDLKIKHGVLGLLKNVSHAQRTRGTLGDAGTIEALASSRIWTREGDFAEIPQVSAIGIAKLLCTGNLDNTLRLVVPELPADADPTKPAPASALELILALVIRSDSVPIKSEGTRVIATVVKSLYTAEGDASIGHRRRQAIDAVTTFDSASILAQMICRSRKFPVLLNEAIVALTLLAYHKSGAAYVLHSLNASLTETHPSPSTTSTSLTSPVSPTGTAFDMLQIILANEDGKFPPELRANVCSLFSSVGKKVNPAAPGREDDVQAARLKGPIVSTLRSVVEGITASGEDEKSTILRTAAQKAIEAWE
ncbi:hypothetical protein EXIGLDRAFT_837361 [Exidia glandulosa HHB12029]|uniref:ARM repeat-containing protein n=1 Tax=Exidia glandulosa HHB12029 TaxID=1314781 RepID=A0A165GVA7_EXIGL|nr:hypothetical protein EXIGLDRAFT_837361 [Exidia glandulosa HHB12029]